MRIRQKIGSLSRRKIPFFCLTYDWDSKEIIIINDKEEYIAELLRLRELGMAKRCECNLKESFRVCEEEYQVMLTSFGDIRADKFVYGENPIAKEFGVCMFDYVFIFLVRRSKEEGEENSGQEMTEE